MIDGYGKALKKLRRDHGCVHVRAGKGDHEIWYSPITKLHVTVDSGCRSRHTAKAVLKQAGIDHRF
jgi:HicA toxin of bacterial toxin-antitoxin,